MSQRDPAEDLERRFVDLLPVVHRLTHRLAALRNLADIEAEEFRSRAEDHLMEDDYRVLREFRGKSSLETYLAVVLRRKLNDYCDHLWGKWRPCAYAQRVGGAAIEFDRIVNAQRATFDEAFEAVRTRGVTRETAWEWYERVRRVERPRPVPAERVDAPSAAPLPDQTVAHAQRQASVAALEGRVGDTLRGLSADDRVLLHLFDIKGLPMKAVARMLGGEAKLLYRRRETLLRRLRREFEALGLTVEDDLEGLLDAVVEDPTEVKR